MSQTLMLENLLVLINKIFTAIDLTLREEFIFDCYRILPKKNVKTAFSPPIIVKLTSNLYKKDILRQKKLKKNNLKLDLLDGESGGQPIYINELMSPFNNRLFKEAKIYQSQGKIKYVWFNNNNVKIRISDNSQIKLIKSLEDFDKIFKATKKDVSNVLLSEDDVEYGYPDSDFSSTSQASTSSKLKKRKVKPHGTMDLFLRPHPKNLPKPKV
uniref:FP protein C-terminal domain-containing protein n=1 Tax=Rhodnius prolixus TaxID=13249 RepID=T1IGN8_RHOPR